MFASDAAAVPRLVARLAELEQEEADAVRIRDYATAERVQLERKLLGATAGAPERAPPPAVVTRPVVTRPSQR